MTKQQQNKIHIGNISYRTTKETLEQEFAVFGKITDVSFPLDKQTGRPRGFAFISFETPAAQQAAVQKDGLKVDGRPVRISEARPFEPKSPSAGAPRRSYEGASTFEEHAD